MDLKIIKCLEDNFSYILINGNNQAMVIDPSEEIPIIEEIEKSKINLKFILNTHHHGDHVGGNIKLKKKYGCIILGFEEDKNRIPGIDVFLHDKEIWESNNFKFKSYHVPGHTSGHACYHFFKDKILFTGDTLFSLGCGRIFEGTFEQMFKSLNLIKKFPEETKIYFGHEYTKKNSLFCLKNDPDNINLKNKIKEINIKIKNNIPTTPSLLMEELKTNIFLKTEDFNTFSKLRKLRDNF